MTLHAHFFRRFGLLTALSGLLLSFAIAAPATEESLLNRRPTDWRDQVTLKDGWQYVRGDLGGVWEALRSNARALDLPVWTPVSLPHSFNASDAVDPDIPYYEGPGWYRTELTIENPHKDGRTLLHFEGAGQKSEVWIGDQKVGSHVGGYDEFVIDITDAVAAYRASKLAQMPDTEYRVAKGKIPLAVRCDNSRDLESMPSDLSDFNLYGGLHRPVHLVYLPVGGVTRVHATPAQQADGSWNVAISLRFAKSAANVEQPVIIRILSPEGGEVIATKINAKPSASTLTLPAIKVPAPKLWSPATPALYGVEVTVAGSNGTSQVFTRFGFRSFEFVEKGPFKLNGERLLLRGTHRHEDHAGTASAMTDDLMEKEMRLMKKMGVNFIRLGHYQQSRRILELCDELGIIVWEEIPWCRGGLGGEKYREQGRAMLRAMIDQHRNHPSVILWGMGNENDWPGDFPEFDKQKIRAYMKELHDLSHELDPTRVTAIRRCEFCADIVDVYSPSIWAGWYRGQFTEYQDVSRKEMEKVKRFLHVEWGGDSHAGRHAEDPYALLRDLKVAGAADERGLDFISVGGNARASKDGDWSETYICDMVDWHLKEQEKMPWLTGTAMWPFKDFSTPLRPENPIPFVNQKGAVERDLTPKESYYVYQSYWTTEPMIRIYGHSWPVRWGKADEKRWVNVYSNCEEVELWLNGVSQGVKKRDSQNFPAAGLRWQLPFESGVNMLRAVGRSKGQTVSDEITFRYETRKWGAKDHLRLQQLPALEGRARVQVELLDAKGVICLDSRDYVRFGHTGDGRLLDNLGTAGGSRKVQLANGRALIDIALPPDGKAIVSAHVDGVPTALIDISQPSPAKLRAQAELQKLSPADISAKIVTIERDRVLALAKTAMALEPVSLRSAELPKHAAKMGAAPGDFLSMGDYWWPNPETPDGLPYIQRDGQSNPNNFDAHRLLMRKMRDNVAALASAYVVSGDAAYAQRAAEWMRVFFVDQKTRMNPHLRFAQAIFGITPGRGIGIIDTLHLTEVPLAAAAIEKAPGVSPQLIADVRAWFKEYTDWMLTHPNGKEEAAAKNNHSVAYYLQVAVFARFIGDQKILNDTRKVFLERLLPLQLALDGSFPRELVRTKPYGYSIFQLDNVICLADVLSTSEQDLWKFSLPDGRNVSQAVAFLYSYLADRSTWPYSPDIAYFDLWPVRQPALLLAGLRTSKPEYIELWQRLDPDPTNLEVRRNVAVTQPLLWLTTAPR